MDGGYYDNLGTTALLAVAEALKAAHAKLADDKSNGRMKGTVLKIFVVQIWSDPERGVADIPGCQETKVAIPDVSPPSPLDFLLSPFGALIDVRGERANGGAEPIAKEFCKVPTSASANSRTGYYYPFAMGVDADNIAAPLNWVLSEGVRRSIAEPSLNGFPKMRNNANLIDMAHDWCEAGDGKNCPARAP